MTLPLLIMCAWCDTVQLDHPVALRGTFISEVNQTKMILAGQAISHGICKECYVKLWEEELPIERKVNADL